MFLEDALPDLSGYAIGKMAQLGLMNALAVAGTSHDIRVNAKSDDPPSVLIHDEQHPIRS